MNINEINDNLDEIIQINSLNNFLEYNYSATQRYLQLDDYVIHKVELLNKAYDNSISNSSIELSGASIGDLFYLKNQNLEISSLSSPQFYAFLSECDLADLRLPYYKFKNDYILIHKDHIDEFHLKYSSTSAVWGGFKLAENTNVINYYKKPIATITIPDELKELDLYAQDSIYRALGQKHAFERFLKLYHLLELEFDYTLIKKIQSLNITTDSNQIGTLLNEYNRNEFDRLYDLISNTCHDIYSLALKLNGIKTFKALGEDIFIRFGKGNKGNLFLAELLKYNSLLSDADAFINSTSVQTHANVKLTDYNKFIHNVTAYWIYRIRCSIAHFKIGEYILTRDKEDFIVEFAEPLIKEVLIQFYKK